MKNTKDQWLIYGDTNLKLVGYTDFNFQSDCDDSRSVLGYVFILNGGAICQKCSKQHTMANSVCKVKYNAVLDAVTYSAPLSLSMRDRELR